MDLIVREKKNTAAKSLTSYYTQATNAINVLKGIKTNLQNLKTQVIDDGDFDQSDIDSVQTVIGSLLADIATI